MVAPTNICSGYTSVVDPSLAASTRRERDQQEWSRPIVFATSPVVIRGGPASARGCLAQPRSVSGSPRPAAPFRNAGAFSDNAASSAIPRPPAGPTDRAPSSFGNSLGAAPTEQGSSNCSLTGRPSQRKRNTQKPGNT
jgi:hypothetical protein